MNSTGPNYPEKVLLVSFPVIVNSHFSKDMEVAFVARLTMASETGSDGAPGGSGAPQSINISSYSPSAISDSFGQSEATPGTKKNSDFFVRKSGSIIINVLLIQTLTVSSCFSSGHSQGNSQSISMMTEATINQSTRMSNLPESPLVQSHLSATSVLDDIATVQAAAGQHQQLQLQLQLLLQQQQRQATEPTTMIVTMQQPSNIGTTTITSTNNVDATNSATMKNGMEQQQQHHHHHQQQQPQRGSNSNIMTDHNKSNQMTSQQNRSTTPSLHLEEQEQPPIVKEDSLLTATDSLIGISPNELCSHFIQQNPHNHHHDG